MNSMQDSPLTLLNGVNSHTNMRLQEILGAMSAAEAKSVL